jgi:hypothetical protein
MWASSPGLVEDVMRLTELALDIEAARPGVMESED